VATAAGRATAMSVEAPGVTARPRLAYVDSLRVLLITVVMLDHLVIAYGAPIGNYWYYIEKGPLGELPAALMSLLTAIAGTFMMGGFFFIAGYFVPGSVGRKGPATFVVDRLKRLGIPLVVYAVVFTPILCYPNAVFGYSTEPVLCYPSLAADGSVGSFSDYVVRYFQTTTHFGVGPMWFAEALLLFSFAYALWHWLSPRSPAEPNTSRAPRNRAIQLAALAIAVVTFVVRIWAPVGYWLEPFLLPIPQFAQFCALFALGIVAYRRGWLDTLDAAQTRPWRRAIGPLVLLLLALYILGGATSGNTDAFLGGFHWQSLALSVLEQFMGMAIILSLVTWFRDRVNRPGGVLRAIGGDTYAAYVLHPAVLLALGLLLSGIQLDLALKFLLVAPVGVALCFLVAHYFRMLPLAREVL
jgi:fucose 4-O-acetylase-like acetyltransferase